MELVRLEIHNYLCYYERNTFNFSEGLNLILGANGEGKTKLFEAIEWLFGSRSKDSLSIYSAKKASDLNHGGSFDVSVKAEFNKNGRAYILCREHSFTISQSSSIEVVGKEFWGEQSNDDGERYRSQGEDILEKIFPIGIRRYSLFKGESALDIFENSDALRILVEAFSISKYFNKYEEISRFLLAEAEKEVEREANKSNKNKRKRDRISSDISDLNRKLERVKEKLTNLNAENKRLGEYINSVDQYIDNAEKLAKLKNRLSYLENDKLKLIASVKDKYTTYLFDDLWIVESFEPIFERCKNNIWIQEEKRRELERDFLVKLGEKRGEENTIKKLTKKKLPAHIPDEKTMRELIRDEECLVCGRKAEKGSEAYQFMQDRLNALLESREPAKTDTEKKSPYVKNYTNEQVSILNDFNNNHLKELRSISERIQNCFKFNAQRKKDIQIINSQIDDCELQISEIIGNSKISSEKLQNNLLNYREWNKKHKQCLIDITLQESEKQELEDQLSSKRTEMDEVDKDSAASFLIKKRELLRRVESIMTGTKRRIFLEFVSELETEANLFFGRINAGSFTGRIKMPVSELTSSGFDIDVQLLEADGNFFSPNQSLETSMHISILFAISSIANRHKQESFPMIFDAPTSSFDSAKNSHFLRFISDHQGQIIIATKDYLSDKNGILQPKLDGLDNAKVYRISLKTPFDQNDLTTIQTRVTPIN